MIRLLAVSVAATAALVFAAAAASTPPPTIAHVGVNHARPVAGHAFAGFMVTPAATGIVHVDCDARVHGKTLHGRVKRFYGSDTGAAGGPIVAVSCGWNIPANAHGTLTAGLTVESGDGTLGPAVQRWHIRRA